MFSTSEIVVGAVGVVFIATLLHVANIPARAGGLIRIAIGIATVALIISLRWSEKDKHKIETQVFQGGEEGFLGVGEEVPGVGEEVDDEELDSFGFPIGGGNGYAILYESGIGKPMSNAQYLVQVRGRRPDTAPGALAIKPGLAAAAGGETFTTQYGRESDIFPDHNTLRHDAGFSAASFQLVGAPEFGMEGGASVGVSYDKTLTEVGSAKVAASRRYQLPNDAPMHF